MDIRSQPTWIRSSRPCSTIPAATWSRSPGFG